jgi:hypothetical protein
MRSGGWRRRKGWGGRPVVRRKFPYIMLVCCCFLRLYLLAIYLFFRLNLCPTNSCLIESYSLTYSDVGVVVCLELISVSIDDLKKAVLEIGSRFQDREERARRLFMTERPASLVHDPDRELRIKTKISQNFDIPYSAVSFCGSGQIGFSITKDKLFEPGVSDLDVACINAELFQRAWMDVIHTSRAFSDTSVFGRISLDRVSLFKEQIVKRGMIQIDSMPVSILSRGWKTMQNELSREHNDLYRRVSVAVYINEYAFCWKQDSALSSLLGVGNAK